MRESEGIQEQFARRFPLTFKRIKGRGENLDLEEWQAQFDARMKVSRTFNSKYREFFELLAFNKLKDLQGLTLSFLDCKKFALDYDLSINNPDAMIAESIFFSPFIDNTTRAYVWKKTLSESKCQENLLAFAIISFQPKGVIEAYISMLPGSFNATDAMVTAASLGHIDAARVFIKYITSYRGEGFDFLHTAALNGHTELLEFLLDNRPKSIPQDENLNRLLHVVCLHRNFQCLRVLVEKYKLDINACNEEKLSPLHYACQLDDIVSFQYLFKKGAKIYVPPAGQESLFEMATRFSSNKVKKFLTERNLNLKSTPPNLDINAYGSITFETVKSEMTEQITIGLNACRENNLDSVKKLISQGADLTLLSKPNHRSALHYACANQNYGLEILSFLIQNQKIDINAVDASGDTPLHVATRLGRRDLIEYLIQKGAGLNLVNIYWELPFECLPQESPELQSLFPENARVINRNRRLVELPEIVKKPLKAQFSSADLGYSLLNSFAGQVWLRQNPGILSKLAPSEWAQEIRSGDQDVSNFLMGLLSNLSYFEKINRPNFLGNLDLPEEAWTYVCPEGSLDAGKNALNLLCNEKMLGILTLLKNRSLFKSIPFQAWQNGKALEKIFQVLPESPPAMDLKKAYELLFRLPEFIDFLTRLPEEVLLSTRVLWCLCDHVSGRLALLNNPILFKRIPSETWLKREKAQGDLSMRVFWRFFSSPEFAEKINENHLSLIKELIPLEAWFDEEFTGSLAQRPLMLLCGKVSKKLSFKAGIIEALIDPVLAIGNNLAEHGIFWTTFFCSITEILDCPSLLKRIENLPISLWTTPIPVPSLFQHHINSASPIDLICATLDGVLLFKKIPNLAKHLPVKTWTIPRKIGEYPDITPLQSLSCKKEGREFLREYPSILKSFPLEFWFIQSLGTPIMPFLTFCSTEEDSKFILGADLGLLDRITSEIWAKPVEHEKYFGMNLFASILALSDSRKILLAHPRPLNLTPEIWLRKGEKGTKFQDGNALVILISSDYLSYDGIEWLEKNPNLLQQIPLEAWNSKAFFLLCATAKGRKFLIAHPKLFINMPEGAWLHSQADAERDTVSSPLSMILYENELLELLINTPGLLERIPSEAWLLSPVLFFYCEHPAARKRFLESPEFLCTIPLEAWKTLNFKKNFTGTNPLFFLLLDKIENPPQVSDQHYHFFSKLPREVWLAASSGAVMTGCNPLFLLLCYFPNFLLQEPRILDHIPGEAWSAEISGGISALWMVCAIKELIMPILIKNPKMAERIPREAWKRVPQYIKILLIDFNYKISPLVLLASSEDASSFLVNQDFLLDMLQGAEVTLPEDAAEEVKHSFSRIKNLAETLLTFKKIMRLFVAIDSTEINYNNMAIIFQFRKTNKFEKNFEILALIFNYFKIEFVFEEEELALGLPLDKFQKLSLEQLNFIFELCSQLQKKGEIVEKNEALIKKIEGELQEKSKTKKEGGSAADKKPPIIRLVSPPQQAASVQAAAAAAVKKKNGPSKNKNPKSRIKNSNAKSPSQKMPKITQVKSVPEERSLPPRDRKDYSEENEKVKQHVRNSAPTVEVAPKEKPAASEHKNQETVLVRDRENDQFQKRVIFAALIKLSNLEKWRDTIPHEVYFGALQYQCMRLQLALRCSSKKSTVSTLFNKHGAQLIYERDALAHYYFPDLDGQEKMPAISPVLLESMEALCKIFGKPITAEMQIQAKKSSDQIYDYCSAVQKAHDMRTKIKTEDPRPWFVEKINCYQNLLDKISSEQSEFLTDAQLFYISRLGELSKHLHFQAPFLQKSRDLILHQCESHTEEADIVEYVNDRKKQFFSISIPANYLNSVWIPFINSNYDYPRAFIPKILRRLSNPQETCVKDMTEINERTSLEELITPPVSQKFLLIPMILPDFNWFGLAIQLTEGKISKICCVYAMQNQTAPIVINLLETGGFQKYQKIESDIVSQQDRGPRFIENLLRSTFLFSEAKLPKKRDIKALREEQAKRDFELYLDQFVQKGHM